MIEVLISLLECYFFHFFALFKLLILGFLGIFDNYEKINLKWFNQQIHY